MKLHLFLLLLLLLTSLPDALLSAEEPSAKRQKVVDLSDVTFKVEGFTPEERKKVNALCAAHKVIVPIRATNQESYDSSLTKTIKVYCHNDFIGFSCVKDCIETRSAKYISHFFIDDQYQGHNIGRTLFSFIKSLFKPDQLFSLETLPTSIKFYQKLGFKVEPEFDQYYMLYKNTPLTGKQS